MEISVSGRGLPMKSIKVPTTVSPSLSCVLFDVLRRIIGVTRVQCLIFEKLFFVLGVMVHNVTEVIILH